MSNLKVGDRVRFLEGGFWGEDLVGEVFEITEKDDFGLVTSNDYYVQDADGSGVSGYPVEKVTALKIGERGDIVVTPEEIEAFKKAWHAADALGLKGSRVEAGLIAVKRLQ